MKEKENMKRKTRFASGTLDFLQIYICPSTKTLSLLPLQLEPWPSFYFSSRALLLLDYTE